MVAPTAGATSLWVGARRVSASPRWAAFFQLPHGLGVVKAAEDQHALRRQGGGKLAQQGRPVGEALGA
eukprot:1735041-Lingulodinium_polyedra.AAC.1